MEPHINLTELYQPQEDWWVYKSYYENSIDIHDLFKTLTNNQYGQTSHIDWAKDPIKPNKWIMKHLF